MLSRFRTIKPSQICTWAPRYFVDVFGDPDIAVTARYVVIYYQTSGRDTWFDTPREHLLAAFLKIGHMDEEYQRRIENGLKGLRERGFIRFDNGVYRPQKELWEMLRNVEAAPLP